MRGRPADWQATFADRPAAELVPAIVAAGFQGLWLDRSGYADDGEQAVKDLRKVIGYDADLEREDGRVLFWDLRPYADALRARQGAERLATLAAATLEPVRWRYSKGFHEREVGPEGSFRWAIAAESEITFENDSSDPRTQLLRMRLARPGGTPAFMSMTLPDGRRKSLGASPEGTPVRETVELPPGESTLRLHVIGTPISEGPEGRKLYVQVQQLQLVDPSTLAIR